MLYGIFAIITGILKVGKRPDQADRQNLIGLSVTRAMSGLGLSISAPAGFGILGVTNQARASKNNSIRSFW